MSEPPEYTHVAHVGNYSEASCSCTFLQHSAAVRLCTNVMSGYGRLLMSCLFQLCFVPKSPNTASNSFCVTGVPSENRERLLVLLEGGPGGGGESLVALWPYFGFKKMTGASGERGARCRDTSCRWRMTAVQPTEEWCVRQVFGVDYTR